jgi:anaerobic selenocysteine-containing dehydrogenase
MTQGYACIKGLQLGEIHQGPQRLLRPLERQPDGSFQEIDAETALDRIAARLKTIMAAHGPDALGLYRGTQHYSNTTAFHMMSAFIRATGTRSRFSTMTIDQSAKWVVDQRLGVWAAGRHTFASSDVWMFVGYNPLVSVQSINGFQPLNATKTLKAAKQRGMKLIVIDPRQTETARYADVHLQLYPGEDVAVLSGLLHIILREGWQDQAFCDAWVADLPALKAALDPYTPAWVAARAGVSADDLYTAARIFAHECRRGVATGGTGADMGPYSNLAEQLLETLNVVCGRYNRAGDRVDNPGAMCAARSPRAEVIAPSRSWETGRQSRVRNLGMLYGEKMTGVLAEEILTPGPGQIRAMIVDGGNPANALPNRSKALQALNSLELLVAIDPYMSETARCAHYILPPTMMLERPDIPAMFEKTAFPAPFAQYAPAIVSPPAGSDVMEDWYVFWAIARRLGLPMEFNGQALDMSVAPDTDQLLDILLQDAAVPVAEMRRYPGGKIFDVGDIYVSPASEKRAGNRFVVAAADVQSELAAVYARVPVSAAHPLRLSVRRSRQVMNSTYRDIAAIYKQLPENPLWMHPDDLASLGLSDGQTVTVASAHGQIRVPVSADKTMKVGVVSLSHCWGGQSGYASNDLISGDPEHSEPINGMPWYTGVPVAVMG